MSVIRLYHGSPEENFVPKFGLGNDRHDYGRGFMPNWIGQFYAYAQWKWGVPSSEIIRKIPVRTMRIAYPGIHDLDMPLAVERMKKVTQP